MDSPGDAGLPGFHQPTDGLAGLHARDSVKRTMQRLGPPLRTAQTCAIVDVTFCSRGRTTEPSRRFKNEGPGLTRRQRLNTLAKRFAWQRKAWRLRIPGRVAAAWWLYQNA